MSETDPTIKQKREDAELCAGYLKALGDSNRLQIIKALQSSPLTVTDLSLLLDSEMANVSHHLRVLFHAGLVTTQRDGKFIYYQINRDVIMNKTVAQALDFGCCRLDMRSAR
jgi:DNA-binding transcriptional ArsR family regulator